jgi:hypothetical protein
MVGILRELRIMKFTPLHRITPSRHNIVPLLLF